MRFTSVKQFIAFVELMEEVGYASSISHKLLMYELTRLPYYISNYLVQIAKCKDGYLIGLKRARDSGEYAYSVLLLNGKDN